MASKEKVHSYSTKKDLLRADYVVRGVAYVDPISGKIYYPKRGNVLAAQARLADLQAKRKRLLGY